MPSSDLIEPTRLESLLEGAPPESEHEAIVQGLVRELRVDPFAAPPELRERVRALEAPAKRHPRIGQRAGLALAVLTLLAASGVLAGLIMRSSQRDASPPSGSTPAVTTFASGEPVAEPAGGAPEAQFDESAMQENSGDTALKETSRTTGGGQAKSVLPAGERAQDVDMAIELRLSDADELSDATNDAMRATRDLGGLIVSSSVDTGGAEGLARLELRIPVRRLEDAVLRLSSLGTITSQQVATRDLQGGIDRRAGQILALQRAIERDRLILASGTLTPEERLEVELRLADQRARVRDLRRDRARLIRDASMAELSLTLHTRAVSEGNRNEGGVAGAARNALDFLSGAGAVAVFALVVASPLIALAALLWALLRSRRRRLDDRLLEQPRPHAPPS